MNRDNYDLVVVGGGLAGTCAALSAARLGCSVALIQDRSVLGGNSSSEIRVDITGASGANTWARETGIIEELLLTDRIQDARRIWLGQMSSIWDLTLYDKVSSETNIDLYLETSARSVSMSGSRILAVLCSQLGTEKEIEIRGRWFVDATGDGTIAFKAGAETRIGRESRREHGESLAPEEPDDWTQGSSLLFHATDAGRLVPFAAPAWAEKYLTDQDLRHRTHDDLEGGYWWIEIGRPPYHTIDDYNTVRHELLRHLLGVWDHIKNHGDHGAANLFIDWIGTVPGKRESRRVIGDCILTEQNLRDNTLFEDRVAYGGWFIDIHAPGGILSRKEPPEPCFDGNKAQLDRRQINTYGIPYRCLYSKDIDNLFLAGRDISVTHVALASTRVMGTCAVIGQAVGTAAFLCRKHGVDPRAIYPSRVRELQQSLLKQDCYIPFVANEDPADLARGASVEASSSAPLAFRDGELGTEYDGPRQRYVSVSELDQERAQLFPVSGDRIDRVELLIESKSENEEGVELDVYASAGVWDFGDSAHLKKAAARVRPDSLEWVNFDIGLSVTPASFYWIGVKSSRGVYWRYARDYAPAAATSGTRLLRKFLKQRGSYSLRLHPRSFPYQASNIVNGYIHPERWTNLWVSDPQAAFPQTVDLDLRKEAEFDTIHILFDTNLNRDYVPTPPLFRAPECAREYRLLYRAGSSWRELAHEKDNYLRMRVHRFAPVTSRKIRLEILSTNGDPSAGVYEMRVYRETEQGAKA